MSEKTEERITLELKICERCGGLWLRPGGSRWIYCAGCKKKVSELPMPALVREKKRPRFARVNGTARSERVQ
ncbi:MAG: hypothetical protein JWO13_1366 [Acidobacteriales bacterium]|nr:hypothetical protein [Terriglobales bacterium]